MRGPCTHFTVLFHSVYHFTFLLQETFECTIKALDDIYVKNCGTCTAMPASGKMVLNLDKIPGLSAKKKKGVASSGAGTGGGLERFAKKQKGV